MKFETHINMDNAAFEDSYELISLLKDIIEDIELYGIDPKKHPLIDSNGNKVGFFEISQ